MNVSLAEELVNITEGETGSFCADIENPMVELERDISVSLFTLEDSATGNV